MSISIVPVLITSRSPAYAVGLAGFLSTPPLAPAVAHTVDAALRQAAARPVALAVIEWRLADAPGLELAAELRARYPSTRVLFAADDEAHALEIQSATGCRSLLATYTQEAVLDAAVDTLRGFGHFDPEMRGSLADLMRRTNPREVVLTEQERVVLRLMRQQLTYKEIALRLGVSWHTIRTHAQSILRKMGIHSRRDLDTWDARLGGAAQQPRVLSGAGGGR